MKVESRATARAFTAVVAAWLCMPAFAAAEDEPVGQAADLSYFQDNALAGPAPGSATTSADCPEGLELVGGGANRGFGYPSESWFNSILPIDGSDQGLKPDDGMRVRIANLEGGERILLAYAVCSPVTNPTYRSERTKVNGNKSGSAKVTCPGGTSVVGGGAGLTGPPGGSYLNSSHPFDGSDDDLTADDGWQGRGVNETGKNRKLDVVAICSARPAAHYVFNSMGGGDFPCESGGHAVSGGIDADGRAAKAHINALFPTGSEPPDDGFLFQLGSTSGSPPPMIAHLICFFP